MSKQESALLQQEIRELTGLLRTDPRWADLRAALQTQSVTPVDALLISFYEDDVDMEYGAIVRVRDRRVFEFQRPTKARAPTAFSLWRELPLAEETSAEYPTLAEAMRMLEEGTIP